MMTVALKKTDFIGRDFLTLGDYTKEELHYFIDLALALKEKQKENKTDHLLAGKTLAMIFEKPSTRTRVSFEVGMYHLGGRALFLGKDDVQLTNGETLADTAQTLSRYVDGIMIRTFEHEYLIELARHATVPVINGLTDDFHPCQVLADFLTIVEKKGSIAGQKLVYVGDGNNMAHSLLMGSAVLGAHCTIVSPKGYEVNDDIFQMAQKHAAKSGAQLVQTKDLFPAVEDADIIYTDVWASMGFEAEAESRVEIFKPYQINESLMEQTKDDCLFFHCLPAQRGMEVTSEVLDGPKSVVFDQAENRLHIQKAIMASLID